MLYNALEKAAGTEVWNYELRPKPKPVKKKPDTIDKLKKRYLDRLRNLE